MQPIDDGRTPVIKVIEIRTVRRVVVNILSDDSIVVIEVLSNAPSVEVEVVIFDSLEVQTRVIPSGTTVLTM